MRPTPLRHVLLTFAVLGGGWLCPVRLLAQVGVGTTSPNANAALDITSTSKGLLIPRLTQAQRTAISSPPDGLMVFQTDGTTGFWYYFGGAWVNIPNAATAGDNLGNHTATQNLNLGANKLVGNGGTAGLSITNAGSVGLGTTTPSKKLHVEAGSILVRGEEQGVVVDEGSNQRTGLIKYTGKPTGLWRTDGIALAIGRVQGTSALPGTPTAYLEDFLLSNTGGVRMLTLAGTGTRLVAASSTGDLSSGTATNGLSLSGANVQLGGTLTQATTISTAGFSFGFSGTGKVGIGTSTPTATLEVSGATSTVKLGGLAGTGTRMVTTDASGNLGAAAVPTDAQTLSVSGGNLSISNGNAVALTSLDAQQLSKSGSTISLTNGGSVTDSDNQNLGLSGASLSISGGTGVTLPDADATNELQTLSKSGSTITLSNGGGTVTDTDTDEQQLSISGSTISLTNGGAVTVPSSADNLGNHTATQNLDLAAHQLVGNGGTSGLSVSSTGFVGIGTTSPLTKLQVTDGDVAFSASDDVPASPGAPGVTGAGRRALWYADKAAFRAGYVDGTQWDQANVGNYSVALGRNPTATGEKSVALGENAKASGVGATAIGANAQASDDDALALGPSAVASGLASVAIGPSRAKGAFSMSIGLQSAAYGLFSTALGKNARANKQGSMVLGDGSAGFSSDSVYSTANNEFSAAFAGGYRFLTDRDPQTVSFYISSAGRVGIGTTSPGAPLTVSTADNLVTNLQGSNVNGTWLRLTNTATNGRTWSLVATADGNGEGGGKLLFRDDTAGADRATFDASGNLGLGTVSPTALLDVNGSARLRGLTGTGTRMVTTDANGNLSATTVPTDTDAQTLSISGSTLSISNGNAVALPSYTSESTTASSGLTLSGTDVRLGGTLTGATTIANGGFGLTVNGSGATSLGTGTGALTLGNTTGATAISGNGIGLTGPTNINTGTSTSPTSIGTGSSSGAVTIGRTGGTVTLANLAGTGTRLVTADASGNLSTTTAPTSESTTASNGLTLSGTDVRLGGTLTGATTIANGGFGLTVNGSGATSLGTGTGALTLGNTTGATAISGNGIGLTGNTSVAGTLSASSSSNNVVGLTSTSTIGTWLSLTNSTTGGAQWSLISTGSANGEGAGRLLIRDVTSSAVRATFDGNGNLGVGTTSPHSTLQSGGTTAFGVATGTVGGSNGSPASIGTTATYLGLSPGGAASQQYYQLPSPVTYAGRMYVIRNNSGANQAVITTAAGSIYAGSSATALTSYTLNPASSVKTVIVFSDGQNWTFAQLN